jgi:ankyrin repeat protein
MQGHLNIVEKLIDVGAEVNAKDKNGATALMWAALNGYFPILEKLIEKGADPDVLNNCRFHSKIIEQWIMKTIEEKRHKITLYFDILLDNRYIMKDKEEKELVKKYLVKRYGNILMVLWGKYPGFAVFEAIIDNFCPTWKDILTLGELYELWGETKYIVRGTGKN